MPKCEYCGKEVLLPFRCHFCGGYFCLEHRLPENHNCPKAPPRTPLGSYQIKMLMAERARLREIEIASRMASFIPSKRIATMMSLVVRFIPVIFDQARETADAQRARGVDNRKNPIYRLKKLGIPLMRRTFERADKLAVAMEARCYSENRTDPGLYARSKDWAALFVVICLCIFIVIW